MGGHNQYDDDGNDDDVYLYMQDSLQLYCVRLIFSLSTVEWCKTVTEMEGN